MRKKIIEIGYFCRHEYFSNVDIIDKFIYRV